VGDPPTGHSVPAAAGPHGCGTVAWVQVAKGDAPRERPRLTPANRSR